MGQPLHLAYRPRTLEEVAGNKEAIETVRSLLARDIEDMPHAWLFSGPAGCGKTTLARIVKDELKCADIDFKEFNSGSTRGIDTIREIDQNSRLSPMGGKVKVYLFDEVHNWLKAAQEASLKMLEDAPKNVFFLLATTNPEKLCKAMRTRLTDVVVKSLNSREVLGMLKAICSEEDVEVPANVLKAIALACNGSAREAVKMLDMVIDVTDEEQALGVINNTHVGEAAVIDLCRALIKGESWGNVSKLIEILDEEPESIRYAIKGYFTAVALKKDDMRIFEILELFEKNWYDGGKASLVLNCRAALDK